MPVLSASDQPSRPADRRVSAAAVAAHRSVTPWLERLMPYESGDNIAAAILQIPRGLFILTSAHEGVRSGVLTRWVQPCSAAPPQIMVAIAKGSPVEPLIRDSRAFALCQIVDGDRLLLRRFEHPPERGEDPFVTLPAHRAPSGSPVIDRALSFLDCEVVRHVDLDADHRLFIGLIHNGGIIQPESPPAIEVGANGSPRDVDFRFPE